MKTVKILEVNNENTGEAVSNILQNTAGIEIEYKLDSLLQKRGMSQRELSRLTGIRQATISALATGKAQLIRRDVLLAIMIVLRVQNINDIISIKLPTQLAEQFTAEAEQWERLGAPALDTIKIL